MSDTKEQPASPSGTSLSLTPALTALIKPTAEYVGTELRDYVKRTVEDWKAKRRQQNISAHVERVREKLVANPPKIDSPKTSFSQLTFFDEWLDHVQDIDPSDEDLSGLWQNLLANAARGEAVRHEIVSALKSLSPREAKFLAEIRGRRPLFPLTMRPRDEEHRYLAKSLEERRLLERDYALAGTFFGALVLSGLMIYLFAQTAEILLEPIAVTAPLLAVIITAGLFFQRAGLVRWRLTWLARELVRHLPDEGRTSSGRPSQQPTGSGAKPKAQGANSPSPNAQ